MQETTKPQAILKLEQLHAKLRLCHGDFTTEYPEQLLTTQYLPSDAKVLELGSNLGMNSCVVASILTDSRNLVTLETRSDAVRCLLDNRNVNDLQFHVENAALSEVPLIQKGWITKPLVAADEDKDGNMSDGYFNVNTITFDQLQEKYNITFDTLVVDAEGAMYQILVDKPSLLDHIKLIIIENDFNNGAECQYAVQLFRERGFQLIYNEGPGYWGDNAFNQVWRRDLTS